MDEINEKFQISLCQDASLQAGLKNCFGNQPAQKVVRNQVEVSTRSGANRLINLPTRLLHQSVLFHTTSR